jgi:hypothetical protein
MSYDWITDEAFTNAVEALLADESPGSLLSIPGVWEIVSEHFNNDAIDLIREDPERFGLTAPDDDDE